jgi:hypothetical protein
MLYAHSDRAAFWGKVEQHCRWTPPESTNGEQSRRQG